MEVIYRVARCPVTRMWFITDNATAGYLSSSAAWRPHSNAGAAACRKTAGAASQKSAVQCSEKEQVRLINKCSNCAIGQRLNGLQNFSPTGQRMLGCTK